MLRHEEHLSRRETEAASRGPWLEWRRLISRGALTNPRSLQTYLKKTSSTYALTPEAPLSDSVSVHVSVSLRACRLYLHCTSAVVMELICWWWIIHTMWVGVSSRSPGAAAVKVNCSSSYGHPNTQNGWCSIGTHSAVFAHRWSELREGIQVKQPILSYQICLFKQEGGIADVPQFCGAEQPSAHTVAPPMIQSCHKPHCGICWSFHMSHSLGRSRGMSPQWPAARHHLSRSTPVQLQNDVPVLLITFSWSSPAALLGEIFQPWCP